MFPEDVGLGLSLGYFTIFCYFFLSTLVYFITTKRYHFHENIFNWIVEFDHKPWRWKSSAFFGANLWWSCSRTRQWNGSRLSWLGDLLIFFCPSFVREFWHVSRFPSYWVDLLLSFSPRKMHRCFFWNQQIGELNTLLGLPLVVGQNHIGFFKVFMEETRPRVKRIESLAITGLFFVWSVRRYLWFFKLFLKISSTHMWILLQQKPQSVANPSSNANDYSEIWSRLGWWYAIPMIDR